MTASDSVGQIIRQSRTFLGTARRFVTNTRKRIGRAPKRRVSILISAAGYGNFGDDVILARWLRFYSDWDLILVCGSKIDSFVDRELAAGFPLDALDEKIIGQIETVASTYKKVCVHLTGGGFCNDKFGTAGNIFELIRRMSPRSITVGTGVSLYPISAQSEEIFNSLRFDHISFRDQYSREMYRGENAYLAGDDLIDAFARSPFHRKSSKDLYINIQNQFEIRNNIDGIARKLTKIIKHGAYRKVVVAELCHGDLDILDHMDRDRVIVSPYHQMMAGKLKIGANDDFIATRFHFRMLAEYSGSAGISIISDDYYNNKHEVGAKNVNFLKSRTRVMSIQKFITEEVSMPLKKSSMNWRRYFKRGERLWLRMLLLARR
jgi:hypothetical protein